MSEASSFSTNGTSIIALGQPLMDSCEYLIEIN